ncbi:hypothetical protein H1R20_g3216, partial [Candolleomyces eurysporus]
MGSVLSLLDDSDQEGENTREEGPHIPTEKDIKLLQEILAQFLPLELVNLILDEAEYWPVIACNSGNAPQKVTQPDGGKPIQRLTEPYAGSWTWFEAAIIRGLKGDGIDNPDEVARRIQAPSTRDTSDNANLEDAFQVPNPWCSGSKVWHLQSNVRASSQETLHEIVWTDQDDPEKKEETVEALERTGAGWGYGFVRELTPGDRIAIYARAQYPGWVNHVGAVEIRMYYSM